MRREDLTGKKFNRLTVISFHGVTKSGNATWLCECECGNTNIVSGAALKLGSVKSCGCYMRDVQREKHTTHGRSRSRLYLIYIGMIRRCYKEKNPNYKNYGAREIRVCDEWLTGFEAFYDWAMRNGYDETSKRGECTLDRVDVDGHYEPSNCRWVSAKVQARNKRNNRLITYKGETKTLYEWAEKVGINPHTLESRFRRGWTVEKALGDVK